MCPLTKTFSQGVGRILLPSTIKARLKCNASVYTVVQQFNLNQHMTILLFCFAKVRHDLFIQTATKTKVKEKSFQKFLIASQNRGTACISIVMHLGIHFYKCNNFINEANKSVTVIIHKSSPQRNCIIEVISTASNILSTDLQPLSRLVKL